MTSIFLQILSLLQHGTLQLFLVFTICTVSFWWVRVFIGMRHRNYEAAFSGSYAVIVVMYREDPVLFERCLASIAKHSKPAAFIVSLDDAYSPEQQALAPIAEKYATKVLYMPRQVGKREQFYRAWQAVDVPIDAVLTVDSDSVWDESTLNILKPFNDPRVGVVSGRQSIENYTANWVRHVAEWFEDIRFEVLLKFQSVLGTVTVVPGRTLAARAAQFGDIVAEIRDERFMGRPLVTSDDASLTFGYLERGFRAVYQSDSLVITDAPNTFRGFWRQYLRWYRGSYRRFFHKFIPYIRFTPLVTLATAEFLFGTFIYGGIVAAFIAKIAFGLYEIIPVFGFKVTESFNPWFIALIAGGYLLSVCVKNIPHFTRYPKDVLFLPVFSTFVLLVMLPLKMVALFTFFENGWMTRGECRKRLNMVLLKTRVIAAVIGVAVLVVTIPLSYIVDIRPTHIPIGVIASGDAVAFHKSRLAIASYQDNDRSNDVSVTRLEHIAKSMHYTENSKAVALCAQASLAKASVDNPLAPFRECEHATYEQFALVARHAPLPPTQVTVAVAEGGSQTEAMRQAVASFAAQHQIVLDVAQQTYAETVLVDGVGRSNLVMPNTVYQIETQTFEQVVHAAQQLTPDQHAAWFSLSP